MFHAYDGRTGHPYLQISPIDWTGGWPRVALEGATRFDERRHERRNRLARGARPRRIFVPSPCPITNGTYPEAILIATFDGAVFWNEGTMKHINPRSFTGLIGITVLLLSHASQAQEGSLAEQVAAAKAHSRQQGDSDVLGHTSGGDYRNEFFGFQLKHIPGWTSMSRGMMNVDEALGRDALGLHAGINPSASRVFGMHDEAGGSVIIVIVRLPEGEATDSASVKAGLIRVVKTQLPSPVVSDETVLLDDASHHFSAVRVSYTVRDNPIFQSMQVLQLNGYAVSVTVSASSENDLKQLLLQLQTSLQWNLKQQSD